MSLIQRKSDAHWYTRDGEPMHTVPYADKKRKDRKPTTLADARKLGLLPSVTTVLKVVAKPGLESWKLEQAIMASLTLPRKKDEPTEDFAKRVVEDMESEASSAADTGKQIHAAIEHFAKTGELSPDFRTVARHVVAFRRWLRETDARILASEKVVVAEGYAGTADLLLEIPGIGTVLADIKSQHVKDDKKGQPKPKFYEEWCYQMSAYAEAMEHQEMMTIDAVASLVMDKNQPGRYFSKIWSDQDRSKALAAFSSAFRIWTIQKNYDPSDSADAAA